MSLMTRTYRTLAIVLWKSLLVAMVQAQSLTAAQAKYLEAARARYYNLNLHGFVSARCSVAFDPNTIPAYPSADSEVNRKQLEALRFYVTFGSTNAKVEKHFRAGLKSEQRAQAEPLSALLSSFIQGVFLTWPTKGISGPIPMFNKSIQDVRQSDTTRVVSLKTSPPTEILLSSDGKTADITSNDGKLREHAIYTEFSGGLIYTGVQAEDTSQSSGPSIVKYEIRPAIIDGFWLPKDIRLVLPNIDVHYSLQACIIKKGVVITLKPH